MKKHIEAWLIMLCVKILLGRNVTRSMVVNRVDNNEMFEMGFKLIKIAERIITGYKFKCAYCNVNAVGREGDFCSGTCESSALIYKSRHSN